VISVEEPPSFITVVGLLVAYGAFVVARSAVVVNATRDRDPAREGAGRPAVPWAVLNALFFVEVFLLIAASYVAASFLAFELPGMPLAAAWLICAAALYVVRAAARALLPHAVARLLGYFVAPVAKFLYLLLLPLTWPAKVVALALARVTRAGVDPAAVSPAAEMEAAEAVGGGRLAAEEREMIDGIFSIRETVAREVMVPRVEMVTADIRDPVDEIKRVVIDRGFSRIPVVDESPDTVLGILHAKDIFKLEATGEDLRSVLREPFYVPESKRVNELLREFRSAKAQFAIVVDEYGGTAGLITLEDVLEEIVGEIHDEYDAEVKLLEKVGENVWLVAGRMDIGELNEQLAVAVPEEDFETVGGFISSLSGKVPEPGERLAYENLDFYVTAADARKVKQVRLTVKPEGRGEAKD
jgi:CBS domain containing-hemolysin-like protein